MNNEPLAFMKEYIEREHEAYVSRALEQDRALFEQALKITNQYFDYGLDSGIIRLKEDEGYFSKMAEQVKDNAPRKIFLFRVYNHKDFNQIYRFYLSTERIKGRWYFLNYYVGYTSKGLRIISRYTIDAQHTGWDWSGGVKIGEPQNFTEVQRLIPPSKPIDMEDYESEEGTIPVIS